MSRPMTRMMTTAVATKPTTGPTTGPATGSRRRWGLRPWTSPTPTDTAPEDRAANDAEESAPFWEYYCLAFC